MGFLRTSLIVVITAVTVAVLPSYFKTELQVNIRGKVAPGWERVEKVFRKQVESGDQPGGAFSVYYKGEEVVNLVGGYADPVAEIPWKENTVAQFFSTTKGVSAIVIATLEERGLLDYKALVTKYWPEFAVNGKEKITIEQLFTHQAGLAVLDQYFTIDDVKKNNPIVSKSVETQKPGWTPGKGVGYHAISIGYYHDQIVRRVDPKHRSLAQFFQEEVAGPMGVDFYVGLPLSENWRCAQVIEQGLTGMIKELYHNPELIGLMKMLFNKDAPFWKTIVPKEIGGNANNNPEFRETPIPSSHGFGTAESVARLYGMVANGGKWKGKTYLSPKLIDTFDKLIVEGPDKIIEGIHAKYGKGFWLRPNGDDDGMTIGTPGAGGQMGYGDLKNNLGWGYLSNFHKMSMETDLYKELWRAMYDSVYDIQKNK